MLSIAPISSNNDLEYTIIIHTFGMIDLFKLSLGFEVSLSNT